MSNNGVIVESDQQAIDQELNPVIAAFEASLDPRTSNDVRKEALHYIEQLTARPQAAHYGIILASDQGRSQAIRYFGLQMIEYAIRYRFDTFDESAIQHVINSITALAAACSDHEPAFFRNKVSQLWVECLERVWPGSWENMDESLGRLWLQSEQKDSAAGIILVLDVLEAISTDICAEENATALRLDDLGGAFTAIVVDKQFHNDYIERRRSSKGIDKGAPADFKYGEEGWLDRLTNFITSCTYKLLDSGSIEHVHSCLLRALATIKSFASWIYIDAILHAGVLGAALKALSLDDSRVKAGAVEVLQVLVDRSSVTSSAPMVIQAILAAEHVTVLARPFAAQHNNDLEEDAVTLQKKLSEFLGEVLHTVVLHPSAATRGSGYQDFLSLTIHVLQNDSLIVSIPVLHSWTKVLASRDSRLREQTQGALAALMQVCAQRLINFELLGEDFDHPVVRCLYHDFDTMPERHAFLANYRRYCVSVIEQIAYRRPREAVEYVIAQTKAVLSTGPYTRNTGFIAGSYTRKSLAVQQAEAQFTTAHSVVAGLFKGNKSVRKQSGGSEMDPTADEWAQIHSLFDQFSRELCTTQFDDPEIEAGIVALLSSIVRNCKVSSDAILNATKHLLAAEIDTTNGNDHLRDSVRNFDSLRVVELQKIALSHADILLTVFDELQSTISALSDKADTNHKVNHGYHAFLFIIILRTTKLAQDTQMDRLRHLLRPLSDAWANPALTHAVSSLSSFQECLGLALLPGFYQEHGFDQVEDWASQQLNEKGQARLTLIRDRLDDLPLRLSRGLLGATTEKLTAGSELYETACQLWQPLMSQILPCLLQMISQAQAFSNLSNWEPISPALRAVIRRSLQDRFWQSGISNETRDEFYARVSGSKTSYEGFASAVRGSIRSVREQGYQVLFLFTKFEEQFYGIDDMVQPLADALFTDADSLSANHLNPLISLMTGLTQGCPPHYRRRFLPPLLRAMFIKLDKKIASDWEANNRANAGIDEDDDDLPEEMRVESVLRQVTYAAISFVAFLLDPDRLADPNRGHIKPTLSDVVLSDTSILEPVILFCTHALRMRDTRCCTTVCKILASILPVFRADDGAAPQVREFICTEVLKAGITSLNEQYFADMQRELAALLAQIIVLYSPLTNTPRDLLLSLPDMPDHKVDKAIADLQKAGSVRQQRALVLTLLENVRGVSIHDMGKVARPTTKPAHKNGLQARYMEVEQKPMITGGTEIGLDSVAGLFADG